MVAAIVRPPTAAALAFLGVAGLALRDTVLTADEIKGLTREYLYSKAPLRRGDDFAAWLARDAIGATLGRRYASELDRHFRLHARSARG